MDLLDHGWWVWMEINIITHILEIKHQNKTITDLAIKALQISLLTILCTNEMCMHMRMMYVFYIAMVKCPSLIDVPNNGAIDCLLGDNGEANPGDTCTYTYNDLFGIEGTATRTCREDETWTGMLPRCR